MKIDFKKLRESHQSGWLAVDFLMLNVLTINLLWILFDSLFSSEIIRQGLNYIAPSFTQFYGEKIHPNFAFYDLCFVGIYLFELGVRWIVAIVKKTYHRWFFYPFIHWYDVLGCIPVGGFRWLRFLRFFAILFRLQKIGVIDLSGTYPAQVVKKYQEIVVEEISDRVIVQVLNGLQDQIRTGSPLIGRISQEVLLPHKDELAQWLSGQLNGLTENLYIDRRDDIQRYIRGLIADTIIQDRRIAALDKIPLLGDAVMDAIDKTVGDLVYNLLDQVNDDLSEQISEQRVTMASHQFLDKLVQPSEKLSQVGQQLLIESIDVIKEEVNKKKWKEVYEQDLSLMAEPN